MATGLEEAKGAPARRRENLLVFNVNLDSYYGILGDFPARIALYQLVPEGRCAARDRAKLRSGGTA